MPAAGTPGRRRASSTRIAVAPPTREMRALLSSSSGVCARAAGPRAFARCSAAAAASVRQLLPHRHHLSTVPAGLEVARAMNLSAGCAALPVEVLLRAQREFVEFRGNDGEPRGLSVAEMGYRTSDFYEMVDTAEEKFRELMSIPDTHEVHVSHVIHALPRAQIRYVLR
jgi:hypothetical protein